MNIKHPIFYRDYIVAYIDDNEWHWCHKDYDGPEDTRCGVCESLTDALEWIEEQYNG